MKVEIKKINAWSFVKIELCFAGLVSALMFLSLAMGGTPAIAALPIVGTNLAFAVLGAFVFAWLYNWFAKSYGGVAVELVDPEAEAVKKAEIAQAKKMTEASVNISSPEKPQQ